MDLSNYFCTKPFESLEFYSDGKVFSCCPNWIDISYGDINQSNLEDIWNSSQAYKLRESIIDGSFKYCKKSTCPYIQTRTLPLKKDIKITQKHIDLSAVNFIMLNNDLTCNLSCPSCRNRLIVSKPDSDEFIKAKNVLTYLTPIYENNQQSAITINITGSGDPFASTLYRQFLINFDGNKYPNVKFEIQTNGLLLTEEMWLRLEKIHKNITKILVSIDASSSKTYQIVRRGGDFDQLLINLNFMAKLRQKHKINLLIARFVVQKKNYFEMKTFAKMCIDIGVSVVDFSLVEDWGSWTKEKFAEQKIWDTNNSDFFKLENILIDPFFDHPRVFLGNLTEIRNRAREKKYNNLSNIGKFNYYFNKQLKTAYSLVWKIKIKLFKMIIEKFFPK